METPKSLGYVMPAEWEKHEATWLVFPHNDNTWPDRIDGVQERFAEMIAWISAGEKAQVIVKNERIRDLASELIFSHSFARKSNVFFHPLETMDSWIRDFGPTFVVNRKEKKQAMVAWDFNGWGMKYEFEEPLSNDKVVPAEINALLRLKEFRPGIVMEGGSIESNGKGTIMTTEQCLLNKNRNPKLAKKGIERVLCDYTGAESVLWLGEGIEGDDTDGHIDDIARFIGEGKVLCTLPEESDAANFKPLKENLARLEREGFDAVTLPLPGKFVEDGRRMPSSYANFYISNSAVIVPVFKEKNDERALDIIQQAFPGRKAVGLYAADVVYGFGSWHCLTQQQPAP